MSNNTISFKIFFIGFVFPVILFFSCQQAVESNELPAFFSIDDYFNEQIQALKKEAYTLEKTITINDRKETRKITLIDFETELAPFLNNDINKPAWSDKYAIDSLLEAGQLKKITYKALESSLKTKLLSIHYDDNETVAHIAIESQSHSVLADSDKKLAYYPGSHYKISGKETSKTGDIVTVDIEGQLILE